MLKFLKKNPSKAGESFGIPKIGNHIAIAIVSVLFLLAIWVLLTTPFIEETEITDEGVVEKILDDDGKIVIIPLIKPLFLPSPQAVIKKFVEVATTEFSGSNLWGHFLWSLFRVSIAFFLAVAIGVPIGIMMGVNRTIRSILDPHIEFYRPIPPLAYLPLIIIWFGIDEESKIILIYLAIFAPIVLNTRAGVRSVPIEQIHAAYSMGASRLQVIRHVIIKGAMPEIITGMRIGIGFGWTTLVAAELVAAEAGLGAMIKAASDFLVTDIVVMGIIVIGIIAYLFDLLMRYLESILVPWKGKV